MGRLEIAGLALGAALVALGVGLLLWPLALVVVGACLIALCLPRSSA